MSDPDFRRRGLLLGAASAPFAATAFSTTASAADSRDQIDLSRRYPFYGPGPQAGIATPPQRHAIFMTFDLTTTNPRDLQLLLARWSASIAQMMKGEPVGQVDPQRAHATALDTGEALDLGPASLTVTVGFGPGLFDDRLGLQACRPAALRPLTRLTGDALHPNLTGGDLSLQACADDPQVAYHAIRVLARLARSTGAAATRWAVTGFGRASAGRGQATPRNLMGFRDGTRNIREPEEMDRFVWADDPTWGPGGSYQVARKIRMVIESWDTDRVDDQNAVFGRFKVSGAPLGGTGEFDQPDFAAQGPDGPVIPANSHIRLAAHENNDGLRILRRSYNYTDGINTVGMLDAGLLFIAYQNDPSAFETLQARLGAADALNEYITHIGSAVFYTPPAVAEGSYIGAQMFT
ncbi:putative deferrochelatase/peroxidase EfeN precursor [Marinibacterium anthonyi]|nr:putative deferrochelatase/peroxidase EfeN precursor [Marinibacterium anthonyi]